MYRTWILEKCFIAHFRTWDAQENILIDKECHYTEKSLWNGFFMHFHERYEYESCHTRQEHHHSSRYDWITWLSPWPARENSWSTLTGAQTSLEAYLARTDDTLEPNWLNTVMPETQEDMFGQTSTCLPWMSSRKSRWRHVIVAAPCMPSSPKRRVSFQARQKWSREYVHEYHPCHMRSHKMKGSLFSTIGHITPCYVSSLVILAISA